MNNEGKFKKSLRDLVNSKEFEFDEANWEKASAMIDSSRSAKGWNGPFVLVSSLLLIVVGITGAYLLYPWGSPELAVKTIIQKPATGISQPKTEPITVPQPKAVVITTKKEARTPDTKVNTIPGSTQRNITSLPEIKEPALNNISKDPVLSTSPEPGVEKNSPEKKIAESTSGPSKSIIETSPGVNPPVAESLPVTKSETEVKIAQPAITANEESKETNSSAALATSNSNVSPENKKPEEVKPEEKTVPEPLAVIVREEQSTPVIPVNSPDASESDQQMPVLETKDETTQVAVAVQPQHADVNVVPEVQERTASEPPKGVGIYPLMPQADSAMLENDKATKLTYDIKEKPVIFSIEAGISYLYGWKNPGKTDANGYNPFVGINFFQTAYDKLSVSLGLQYTSISNLNYSSHTTKVSQLGLGEESTVTVFTPTKIHYLVAPLRVHYRLNRKNIAGLGCNVAYLLTVESDVETYHQTVTSNDGNSIYKDKGYTQGFRPFDIQLSAFYRHRLLSNISFNAEVFYGLVDAKDNTFFHSNVFERNTGLKISLVYNIQKK